MPTLPESEDPHGAGIGVDDDDLRALLAEHWEWWMEQWPAWATRMGDRRYDDRVADRSLAAADARAQARRGFVERARTLAPTTDRDRTTQALFVQALEYAAGEEACRFDEWSVSARYNALSTMESMVETHPDDEAGAVSLRARLEQWPTAVDTEIANLAAGRDDGLVANAESISRVLTMVERWLETPDVEHPTPVAERGAELRAAFTRYRDFLTELHAVARDDERVGLAHLPIGEACYAAVVANYTNQDRTPEAIHRRGLDELAAIHAEFEALGGRLWGTSDRAAVFERLRTDPTLYFEDEQQVEDKARSALARAEAAMGSAFGVLPEADCTVERIPPLEAPFTTIAYYRRPAPDGTRPGTYFVNTYEPTTRPRHEAEVLAFHESIPGHHLQIAIAQELGDLPAFRRNTGSTAYVEGWALYTERLADEMGLYSGDVDRMGMLSFDAWRAARLVVDTGLHHHGWSRQEAIDFLVQNTPLPLNNIDNEVDRYITNPGQALAYKTGQLEILDLRAEAEAALGDAFDLRAFHDALLGGGAVTLGVLRERIEGWIAAGGPSSSGG